MLGHFRMLPRVPRHLEAQWARAMADGFDAVVEAHRNVAAEVPGAAEDLDRALKWQLVLPQLLLRRQQQFHKELQFVLDHVINM